MRIMETKVFTFDELNDEAKEKAREWWREGGLGYEWWECVYDTQTDIIREAGFEVTKMYFSGFWSQGDGAMFEYDGIDQSLLNEAVDSLDLPNWKKSILKNGHISGKGRQGGHYCHENSCNHSIYVETDNGMQYYDNIEDLFDTYHGDIEDFIESKYKGLCQNLYSELETEYEWLMSDEQVDEAIEINEYEFDEEGNNI